MGMYKKAHVRGMVHEMTRRGLVQWPTKQAEEEAADAIAEELPEEVMPEETPEEGLTPEQAQMALEQIVQVAEEIAQKTGGQILEDTQKLAAASSYEDAASHAAVSLMEKAAEETAAATGPAVPGATTPTPDLGATAEAEIDVKNVPSAAIMGGPQGTTEVNTTPGAVGAEAVRPDQPGVVGTPPTSEASKVASPVVDTVMQMLQKMASVDGASLSGGPAKGPVPNARVDLEDNLDIKGAVAARQGTTSLDIPAAATTGVTKSQPAGNPGVTAPTPNEPAKDAVKKAMEMLRASPTGNALVKKIAAEAKKEEEEENAAAEKKRKEEEGEDEAPPKKEEEVEKEAQVVDALKNLAAVLG